MEKKSPYKTIKIPLKSIILNKETSFPVINSIVLEMNELVINTYQFIRLYVLYHYHNFDEIPTIDEPLVMLVLRTLGVRDNRGKKSKDTELLDKLNDFYEKEYQPIFNHEKTQLKNKTYILPYLATQIFTCIENNIKERFIQHFQRFVKKSIDEKDEYRLRKFTRDILGLTGTDEYEDFQLTHLPFILPDNINKNVYYDVKVRPFEYLKGMIYMNSVLENDDKKLFQFLPLRTDIIPKNIIDSSSLVSLFCPENKQKGTLLKTIKENQYDIWNSFLNLNHKIFKNKHYTFRFQIQTDGFSCSLLFIRKDLKDKKWGTRVPVIDEEEYRYVDELTDEELEKCKNMKIVGLDPNKRSLVYMVDENGTKLQYTCCQKKRESKAKCNQRILEKEKIYSGIIELETEFSKHNSKTVDYDKFKEYIKEKHKLNEETNNFYNREVWRKMKFRVYSYEKKSLDKFLNKIQETFGENLLIGYGDWSRTTQMKNFMPTMGKGMRKLIHRRYTTISINEFKTSKNCCECYNPLSNYKDKEGKELHRLLICSNCVRPEVKNVVFRTRDVNSAVNILNLTINWIYHKHRPAEFCRQSSLTAEK